MCLVIQHIFRKHLFYFLFFYSEMDILGIKQFGFVSCLTWCIPMICREEKTSVILCLSSGVPHVLALEPLSTVVSITSFVLVTCSRVLSNCCLADDTQLYLVLPQAATVFLNLSLSF